MDKEYPQDLNNISPRLGFSWALDDEGRSAVRGGFGVFYQRTSYTFLTPMFATGARFSNSFTANFPTNNADPGPAGGNFPTDPLLRNGPVVNHAAHRALFPPGSRIRNGGTVRFDNPDRENAFSRQYSLGYERQIGTNASLSLDFIRSEQRKQYILKELNPGVRDTTVATQHAAAHQPARRPGRRLGGERRDARQRGLHQLQHRPGVGHEAVRATAGRARLSYAFSRGRGNTPTARPARPTVAVPRRPATWTTKSDRPTSIGRTS